MAVSDTYLTFVLGQLEGVPHLVTKRMFGGIGLYSDGTFFGVIDNDTLFFKVDDALAQRYRQQGMPPFAPIPGQAPMKGYYQVPAGVLEDDTTLAAWAADSIAVANRPKPTRAVRSSARGSR